MTLLYPVGLYLSLLSGLVVLLSLLRTRIKRQEVGSLFLWEGLPGERGRRSTRIRLLIDLLLVLQLAALLSLVLAIAQPAWCGGPTARIALLIDTSASMRTETDSGMTRYGSAIERGKEILERYPRAQAAVIALSDHPEILAGGDRPRREAIDALERSRPSWYGDATVSDLLRILAAAGGEGAYDRVILLTDHPFPEPPPFLETIVLSGGENCGITVFTAREDPTLGGVEAFVKVENYTDADRAATLVISDGADSIDVPVVLPAGSSQDYVIPFPSSCGTSFTAALEPGDDFEGDDVRYFALTRPIELALRWIGRRDRYLLAAIRSAVPVREVEEGEEADLTVAYDVGSAPAGTGDVLLVHAGMEGVVRLGADGGGGDVGAIDPEDPILAGVDPADLRVWSTPFLDYIAPGKILLTASGRPLLVEFREKGRRIWFIAPELAATNLPLTVDFPILVRNIVRAVVRLPASPSYGWSLVGEGIPLRRGGGPVSSVIGPDGRPIPLIEGQAAFFPREPGEYRLVTGRGTYPVGVNVPPSESVPPPSYPVPEGGPGGPGAEGITVALWPAFAGLAAILLIVEWLAYIGFGPLHRRAR